MENIEINMLAVLTSNKNSLNPSISYLEDIAFRASGGQESKQLMVQQFKIEGNFLIYLRNESPTGEKHRVT